MRFAFTALFGLALTSAFGADDTPTADEKKAIDAIVKAGGKASINSKLSAKARVAVEFETLNDIDAPVAQEIPAVPTDR